MTSFWLAVVVMIVASFLVVFVLDYRDQREPPAEPEPDDEPDDTEHDNSEPTDTVLTRDEPQPVAQVGPPTDKFPTIAPTPGKTTASLGTLQGEGRHRARSDDDETAPLVRPYAQPQPAFNWFAPRRPRKPRNTGGTRADITWGNNPQERPHHRRHS